MARGGARVGAGRPKGTQKPQQVPAAPAKAPAIDTEPQSPLDYMLAVMNDPAADAGRRDRMAITAAPFVHKREADTPIGKREVVAKTAARRGKTGRFATQPTPARLIVNNG